MNKFILDHEPVIRLSFFLGILILMALWEMVSPHRLLSTYRDQPAVGHEDMTIGLSQFRDPNSMTLPWLLVLPFISKPN